MWILSVCGYYLYVNIICMWILSVCGYYLYVDIICMWILSVCWYYLMWILSLCEYYLYVDIICTWILSVCEYYLYTTWSRNVQCIDNQDFDRQRQFREPRQLYYAVPYFDDISFIQNSKIIMFYNLNYFNNYLCFIIRNNSLKFYIFQYIYCEWEVCVSIYFPYVFGLKVTDFGQKWLKHTLVEDNWMYNNLRVFFFALTVNIGVGFIDSP